MIVITSLFQTIHIIWNPKLIFTLFGTILTFKYFTPYNKQKMGNQQKNPIKISEPYNFRKIDPHQNDKVEVEDFQDYSQAKYLSKEEKFNVRKLKNVTDLNLKEFENLKEIKFCDYFNTKLYKQFPKLVRVIIFGNKFNQYPDNLPIALEKIVFGRDFNQYIYRIPAFVKIS